MKRSRWVGLLVAVVVWALAPAPPVRSAGSTGNLTPEMAREAVDEIAPDVARIRGLEFKKSVPVSVIDDAEAAKHILSRVDRFQMKEQLQQAQVVYEHLGLIDEGVDILAALMKAMEVQAGGFYDPASDSYFLLDDMPAAAVGSLTSHELTHALEDQHFDLDQRMVDVLDNDDQLFALGAIHEGSATLVMTIYTAKAIMEGTVDLVALGEWEKESGQMEALAELPSVLSRQLIGPYILGARFLTRGNMLAAMTAGFPIDDVARVFADGPRSSEQIIHPEKYWDEDELDPPIAIDDLGIGKALGKRWTTSGGGVLGELVLAVMTGATKIGDPNELMMQGGEVWTNEAAKGWGGDRWELWSHKDAQVTLVKTVWDSEVDAIEFSEALDGSGLAVRLSGRVVAIAGGDLAAPGKKLESALGKMLEP